MALDPTKKLTSLTYNGAEWPRSDYVLISSVELEEAVVSVDLNNDANGFRNTYSGFMLILYTPKNTEATNNLLLTISASSDGTQLFYRCQSQTWGSISKDYNVKTCIFIDIHENNYVSLIQLNNNYSSYAYPQNAIGTCTTISSADFYHFFVNVNTNVYPSFPVGTKMYLYGRRK